MRLSLVVLVCNAVLTVQGAIQYEKSLLRAVCRGDVGEIERLIDEGADVKKEDQRGRTYVWFAANEGHAEVVQLLLKAKACVDKPDRNGWRPLWIAACKGYTETVKVLIKYGADVSKFDCRGKTSLCIAADGGHTETVRALLEQGADASSEGNRYILATAALRGHTAAMQLLIKAGAALNEVSGNNKSPLQIAVEHDYGSMIRILLNAGAHVGEWAKDLWPDQKALLLREAQSITFFRAETVRECLDRHAHGNFPADLQGLLEKFVGSPITEKTAQASVDNAAANPNDYRRVPGYSKVKRRRLR